MEIVATFVLGAMIIWAGLVAHFAYQKASKVDGWLRETGSSLRYNKVDKDAFYSLQREYGAILDRLLDDAGLTAEWKPEGWVIKEKKE